MLYRNGCIIDQVDLENLPWERETFGFWLDIPESLLQLFVDQEVNPAGARHPGIFSSVAAHRVSRGHTFCSARRAELHTDVKRAPDGMQGRDKGVQGREVETEEASKVNAVVFPVIL